jgi:WD40 repeat protein
MRWKLNLMRLDNPQQTRLLDTMHEGLVTSLAASPDGTRLASADLQGHVFVWELAGAAVPPPTVLDVQPCALSLAFSPDGKTLVAGTAVAPGSGQSQLQIWDLAARKLVRSHVLPDHVNACAVSPDGRFVAYSGGRDNEVWLGPLTAAEPVTALRGTGRRVWKVAFAAQEPLYRIAWGTESRARGFNDYADLDSAFDATRLELGAGKLDAEQWLAPDWQAGQWTVRREAQGALQLLESGVARGRIELDPVLEGRPRCYCWIPGAPGQPLALAVGTDLQNSIYVVRVVQQGRCPILRQFRGHHDFVTSVGVSRDLRFLASGSADGTICVWSLDGLAEGADVSGRWGAEFVVQQDELRVASLRPAGPLFRRGLRPGDVVTKIGWPAEGETQSEQRPAEILNRLRDLPQMSQVVFHCRRDRQLRPVFQLVPAWQPMATLFVDTNREWAFWTPEGYYDASANGHTLFGWQMNRGLQQLPDFYRADQYVKTLERPTVLQRLLPAGDLDEALRQAAVQPPAETQEILSQHIAATPVIEIVSPQPGALIREGSAIVTARIAVPAPGALVRAKLFANGVVAPQQRLIREQAVAGGTERVYEWSVALPNDPQNLIQLVAGTDAPTAALASVLIERPEPAAAERLPQLSIIAVGVNHYADPAIATLDYSRADAEAILRMFRDRAGDLYTVNQSLLLANEEVTRAQWQKTMQNLKDSLAEDVSPDDLIVLFLAGHGVLDPKTERYYFVGYDLQVADYLEGRLTAGISWEDFRTLSDIPCRKLVVLDTCHSGALQPLSTRSLKAAVRALQEDVFLSLTASAGNERSEEDERWGHGAFTKSLLEALDGRADTSGDGLVTLRELFRYTQETVPQLTEGRQNPTAAPEELLPLISLPLARRK